MDLKGMLADQMGTFTPYDIGGVLVGILLAALVSFIVALFAKRDDARANAVLAALAALAVSLVHASVPLSIALVALMLLMRKDASDGSSGSSGSWAMRLAALVIGAGCGSSASIIVLVAALPLALLLRWGAAPKN